MILDQTSPIKCLLRRMPNWNSSILLLLLPLFFFPSFIATLQLSCDPAQITAHIGGEFTLRCKYDTTHFLFSKKYWCRGESHSTCEVLVDSEHRTQSRVTHRSHVVDARRGGLFVKVKHLQFDDSGVYWVGIDKIYADIMTSVKLVVTEGTCYGFTTSVTIFIITKILWWYVIFPAAWH